jgi:hypothetical protein
MAVTAAVLLVGGCRGPVLVAEDVIVRPGGKARLVAFAERGPILGLGKDLGGVRLTFQAGGAVLGDKKTGDEGKADIRCRLPAGTTGYEARATALHQDLHAAGRVFWWDGERVIIAVDIDHTIAHTEYEELLSRHEEDGSDPLKRSAQTLRDLARDFHILYLTDRTRSLLERTRQWLSGHDFPDGPVLTSESFRQMLRPGTFKEKRLRELRKEWPNLLIGVGNRPSDADAYGANDMLALVIAGQGERNFGRHALVFRDWKALSHFLAANHEVLTDRDALKEVIAGKRSVLCRIEPYQGD